MRLSITIICSPPLKPPTESIASATLATRGTPSSRACSTKLKHLLRKAAARNLEALVAATGELLGAYTAHECANYFVNAGYGQA